MRTFSSFIFNLLGSALPITVALVSVPVISHYAGVERLGALGVVWALVGYFGFLDFGLSRVVTRRVANAAEQGMLAKELDELRGFFWWWMVPALLCIALLLIGLRFLFEGYLPSGRIGQEFAQAWSWVVWSIPITLATNWLRGILEGLHRFARVNLLRTIFGAWTYAAPAIAAIYFSTLQAMIVAIVLGRLLSLVAHVFACVRAERGIVLGTIPLRTGVMRTFVTEGGWMTVSNVIGPMMVYFDRFLLAALQPARSVAWYVTSQEVMLRTLVIPGALASVLFPQFSAIGNARSSSSYADRYQQSLRVVGAMMLPLCVLAAAGAYDGMRIWMGEEFASNSYRLVGIIAIGIFANAIAQLPFAWLQGVGYSKLTAQLHTVELPLYVVGLWLAVAEWGVIGAAWMWTFRVLMDCLMLLHIAARRGAPGNYATVLMGAASIALIGFLTGPALDWRLRLGMLLGGVAIASLYAWFGLLSERDRDGALRLRLAL